MGRMLKIVGWGALAAIVLAIGVVGWNLYAKPFSLRLLVDRQAVAYLIRNPQFVTSIGAIDGTLLDRHSHLMDDLSFTELQREYALVEKLKAELQAYADPAGYTGQDRLTYAVMKQYLEDTLERRRYPWATRGSGTVYALDQMFGSPTRAALFLQNLHTITNAKLARNYVARISKAAVQLDQINAEMQRQADAGVILPAFLFDKIIDGVTEFMTPPEKNSLYIHLAEKTGSIKDLSPKEREALLASARASITDDFYPALTRVKAALESLRPRAANDAGVWKLPDGEAFYASQIRYHTTTTYTAEQLHAIGLAEVSRIEAQMNAILAHIQQKDDDAPAAEGVTEGALGVRVRDLGLRPDQQFPDSDAGRAQVLARYRELLGQIDRTLVPAAFARTPKASVEVVRMQPFEEIGGAGAYYRSPSLDGTRPGRFHINLRDLSAISKFSMKTLVVHETVPGHHFQFALAQELEGLPLVRTLGSFSAFSEGWALYAERLAWEQGLYEGDRLGDLGRLQAEMLRAARLVVDTGIHAKRWTREQAIAYMQAKTGMADQETEDEIDRYIIAPGQALAYKVGQLKILELRERARQRLGARFDLKAFHAVVLENGGLPLSVLEDVVDRWIADKAGLPEKGGRT